MGGVGGVDAVASGGSLPFVLVEICVKMIPESGQK